MTLGELQAGVEVTRAQDVQKAEEIEFWIDQVANTWNVLPMDARVMRAWARLMVGKQDELIEDGMIAAVREYMDTLYLGEVFATAARSTAGSAAGV